MGTRRRWRESAAINSTLPAALTAVLTAVLTATALVLPPPGGGEARAEPVSAGLAAARAEAAALNIRVDRLQLQAEQSAEAYNAVTDELAQLKAATLVSAHNGDELRAAANRVRAANAERVRLLYQSQGEYGVLGALFAGGTPDDLLDRAQVAAAVVGANTSAAVQASAGAHEGADMARAALDGQRRQALLAAAAAQHAGRVQRALTAAASALAGADAEVSRIAEADRRAAAAAAARAFAARLAAAQRAARLAAEQRAGALRESRPQAGTAGQPPGTVAGLAAPAPAATAALVAARTRLGMPYLWGAVGPTRFDCSGLTGWAYRQAGVSLPRTSRQQWYAGAHPTLAELAPGDLLFWATNVSDPATIHHVALYLGDGLMIAAPRSGDVVKVQPVYGNGYLGAVRPTSVRPTAVRPTAVRPTAR